MSTFSVAYTIKDAAPTITFPQFTYSDLTCDIAAASWSISTISEIPDVWTSEVVSSTTPGESTAIIHSTTEAHRGSHTYTLRLSILTSSLTSDNTFPTTITGSQCTFSSGTATYNGATSPATVTVTYYISLLNGATLTTTLNPFAYGEDCTPKTSEYATSL